MSAVLEAREPSAKYLSTLQPPLVQQFDLLATAPGGVARLRELILTLAVQGKLVPQDAQDEPASELLRRIRVERDRLVAEGRIRRDKPQAKIAANQWPFELPRTWAWERFGDVTLVSSGVTLGRKTVMQEPVSLPYLRVANVQRWHVALESVKEVVVDRSELDRFQIRSGDLLITEGGDWDKVGRTAIWRDELPMCLHQNHVFKARGFNVEWNALWAQLYLNSAVARSYFASSAKQTTNLASINMTELKACAFPVPPLEEQSRIVTRVEELMRLCDALEVKGQLEAAQHAQLVQTLLGALTTSASPEELADNWQRVATHFDRLLDRPEAIDALEQTILHLATTGRLTSRLPSEVVSSATTDDDMTIDPPFELPRGWAWATLGKLSTFVTSGSRSWKDFYSDEGATFIRSQDIKYDRIEFDNRAYVKLPLAAEGVRTKVCLRDVLITITGANVGKAALVLDPIAEAYVSQHVALVRLHDPRLVDYLHLWLVSEHGGRQLLLTSSYGAKPGLNLKNIKDLPVPVPPLAEQVRIVARVQSLSRLYADLRQRLTARQTTLGQLAAALIDEVA